jgi:L,D-transpeptidase ErfK/SrfK
MFKQKTALLNNTLQISAWVLFGFIVFAYLTFFTGDISASQSEADVVMSILPDTQRVLKFSRPNMLGPDVVYLQMLLKDAGYEIDGIDGVYGQKTELAVKAVQNRSNMEVDGIVDQDLWIALFDILSTISARNTNQLPKRQFILIDVDKRRLELYANEEVVFAAPVAVGKSSTPSPLGYWKIVSKGKWSGGFGSRWMGLNVPWGLYGIHGTNKPESIGGALSHGCIRMYNRDVEKLYDLVSVGTPVKIVAGSFGLLGHSRPHLVPGERSSHVLAVQHNLSARGYYTGSLDGIYGWGTETAVRNFQRDHNLSVTGRVDTKTYDALGLILFE